MKKVRVLSALADYWGSALAALICVCLLSGILVFRLGSLTPGLAPAEIETRATATSVSKIVENPLHLHQKLAQTALEATNRRGAAAIRLPNAFVGFISVICMFLILRNWHTRRISIVGTILFATSSWFLHIARLGTNDLAYVMPVTLVLGAIWLHSDRYLRPAAVLTLISALFLLYVPGMIWFVVPAIIWQRRILRRTFRRLSIWWQAALIILTLMGIGLLLYALIQEQALIREWVGMPSAWPTPLEFLEALARIPLSLFVLGPDNPVYNTGQLPLLGAFTSAMTVLGLFAYAFRLKLDRTRLVFGLGIIGSIFIALGMATPISFLLPIIYLLVAAGMALLLQQWFTVFPRNPFARSVGVTIIAAAVLVSGYYHLNRYFVAWPNTPATRAAFSQQPILESGPR